MLGDHTSRGTAVWTLTVALLAVPLAGCVSGDDLSVESYAEAKDAPGVVLQAPDFDHLTNDQDNPVRLKTLAPADPLADSEVGENDLAFLVFDSAADEPVVGAQFEMQVNQTHGDLTSSKTQTPTHTGNGVYEGLATFDESEGWVVDLTITLPDGETLEFPLHYHAGETDHTHEDYFHPKGHDHGDGHDHEHGDEHDH